MRGGRVAFCDVLITPRVLLTSVFCKCANNVATFRASMFPPETSQYYTQEQLGSDVH